MYPPAVIVTKVALCCEVLDHFYTVGMSYSDIHLFGMLRVSAILQVTK
jgi:hypothetical protein